MGASAGVLRDPSAHSPDSASIYGQKCAQRVESGVENGAARTRTLRSTPLQDGRQDAPMTSVKPVNPFSARSSRQSGVFDSHMSLTYCSTEPQSPIDDNIRSTVVDPGQGAVYQLHDTLGHGAFATVFRAVVDTGAVVAIKRIHIPIPLLSKAERTAAECEAGLLRRARHQNLVAFVNSFVCRDAVHLVMELCNGGTLHDAICERKQLSNACDNRCFAQATVLNWAVSLFSALHYLHIDMRMAHRDIKPTNIFLHNPEPNPIPVLKLGDFGLATPLDKCCSGSRASGGGFAGTPAYAAPEVIAGMSIGSAEGDAWSTGCVIQELCTLSKAFGACHLTTLMRSIVHNQRAPLRPSPYPGELLDVVEGLLLPDFEARLSVPTALSKVHNLVQGANIKTRGLYKVPSSSQMFRSICDDRLPMLTPVSFYDGEKPPRKVCATCDVQMCDQRSKRRQNAPPSPDWGVAVLGAICADGQRLL